MLRTSEKENKLISSIPLAGAQKLQKVLAMKGLGSRREIERWIQADRLAINNHPAWLGARIKTEDKITLDGKLLTLFSESNSTSARTRLLLYYKRVGEICSTHDPQNRHTVFYGLPCIKPARWIMVGRLDCNTQGLLLFTTDGLLSHRLLHPSYEIEREYAVRVHGVVTPTIIHKLKQGVVLDGKLACFSSISSLFPTQGSNRWYRVLLKEGRQREVRRLWATQGVAVSRLVRIRFGPIKLPSTLQPGKFIWLTTGTINSLKQCVGL